MIQRLTTTIDNELTKLSILTVEELFKVMPGGTPCLTKKCPVANYFRRLGYHVEVGWRTIQDLTTGEAFVLPLNIQSFIEQVDTMTGPTNGN